MNYKIFFAMVLTSFVLYAQPYSDNASNYSGTGWNNGSNKGTGFSAWSIWYENSGTQGIYLGDAYAVGFGDMDATSYDFGMYGQGSGAYTHAYRGFVQALPIGQTFSIKIAANYRNGAKGIDLKVGSNSVFNVGVTADNYYVDGVSTGWAYDARSVILIECMQTSANIIYVRVTRGSNVAYKEKNVGGHIDGIHLYVGGTDSGTPNDFFFNSLSIRSDNPVPVELSSFVGNSVGNKVNLDWSTATEKNNSGFELQRSLDKENWNKIAFVNGYGMSNSPKNYSYTDATVSTGMKYYYRLKQIDNDGSFEYSKIVEVLTGNMLNGYVLDQNYPNPFNPSTTIKFGFENPTKASLKIYDALGNQVADLFNGTADAGRVYEVQFNASSLATGVYFYKLSSDVKTEVRKMLLIK